MKKLLALASLAVLGGTFGFVASGCGSEKAVSLGPPATGSTSVTEPTGTVPTSVSLEVWFLQGEQLVRQTRSHEATRLVATAAMKALLAGPSPAELAAGLRTSVPAGTKLLGISIKKGVATVDLTSQYQSGGGSLSMKARLAQVVYTLTQFPTVSAVRAADFACASVALFRWLKNDGMAIAARIPRINITTRSSTRVKPDSLPALSRSLCSI